MSTNPTPTPLTEAELDTLQSEAMEDRSVERATMLRLIAAARENAGLREDVKWLKEKRSVGFDNIDDLTTERDAAIRERDDRIRANVGLCEEIKNHRAERDEWKLRYEKQCEGTMSREMRVSNLRSERDAALARVAELEGAVRVLAHGHKCTTHALEVDAYTEKANGISQIAARVANSEASSAIHQNPIARAAVTRKETPQ